MGIWAKKGVLIASFLVFIVGANFAHADPLNSIWVTPDYISPDHNGFVVFHDVDTPSFTPSTTISGITIKSIMPSGQIRHSISLTLSQDNLTTDFTKWYSSDICFKRSTGTCLTLPTGVSPIILNSEIGDTIRVEHTDGEGTFHSFNAVVNDVGVIPKENRKFDSSWTSCTDNDIDGICDSWEQGSQLVIDYPSGAGIPSLTIPCSPGCWPDQKDIFLEIDFMRGHEPDPRALEMVVNAFKNAPVNNPNPAKKGIILHIQVDEGDAFGHQDRTHWPGSDRRGGFDQIKSALFGTNAERTQHPGTWWNDHGWKQKKQVFRYAMFVHKELNQPTVSGFAEILGNDMMISLGYYSGQVGSKQEQAGTLMHELGHNLNLNDGGGDAIHCKPNYLSVMSYSRQMTDLVFDRALDYSNKTIGTLTGNPNTLTEGGLVGAQGFGSYSPSSEQRIVFGNNAGNPTTTYFSGAPNVVFPEQEINYLKDSRGNEVCGPKILNQALTGYNDWGNINLNDVGTAYWGDGVSIEQVTGMRILRIDELEKVIDSATAADVNGNLADVKNAYKSRFDLIRDSLESREILEAMELLDTARRTFDGKSWNVTGFTPPTGGKISVTYAIGPILGLIPNPHSDLITNPILADKLQKLTDGITISYHESLNYLATDLHNVPSPCQESSAVYDGADYDFTYCMKNGEVVEAVFEKELVGDKLVLTINPTENGWIKLDLAKIITSIGPLEPTIWVVIDGKTVAYDIAENHGRKYLTTQFDASSSKISIQDHPNLVPDTDDCLPGDWLCLFWAYILLAIAIATAIAVAAWRAMVRRTTLPE